MPGVFRSVREALWSRGERGGWSRSLAAWLELSQAEKDEK